MYPNPLFDTSFHLMELWITGAQTDHYLLDEKDRKFEGLAQVVYQKLHDSYESDEKVRFLLMDEAKTEEEIQAGLARTARQMTKEISKKNDSRRATKI